ncbi:GNAT family N-acetyltransferase [Cytophagaceae bacterium YF14B1]|uniref:GNAT family N-acetyltransferase n=1 Tax=Xanthocytophaga flava TaxID=3048013 RepID=A0AAE3QWZ3_9BACT|nr:GNAT family N-acetyltransferase [Xanthocytophaga flavus]MDJ1484721.1 GNAT family N-acetyltransferase [Xanthocytophaga flavus]
MNENISQNITENRFELAMEGKTAIVEYVLSGNVITFLHTEVPPQLEGRGIGSTLAKYVLEYAKANQLKVSLQCPFIRSYIDRHPEYTSLLLQQPH